jgi:hypothetical protein
MGGMKDSILVWCEPHSKASICVSVEVNVLTPFLSFFSVLPLAPQRIPTDENNPLYSELKRIPLDELKSDHIFAAVRKVMPKCRGSYAVVVMINGVGIVAFRDKFGIRPLAYGARESRTIPGKRDYCIASESVSMDLMNFSELKDVQPGECIFIDYRGGSSSFYSASCVSDAKLFPCIFEYVYFARPDSVIDGVSVYQVGEGKIVHVQTFYKSSLRRLYRR